MKEFDQLFSVCDILLSEEGCPWDKKQTFETLQGYLLDEAKEVQEAVMKKNYDSLLEELGDLLYIILFFCKLAEIQALFSIKDVLKISREKMMRRHPHIFVNKETLEPDEIAKRWQEIKKKEKKHTGDDLNA